MELGQLASGMIVGTPPLPLLSYPPPTSMPTLYRVPGYDAYRLMAPNGSGLAVIEQYEVLDSMLSHAELIALIDLIHLSLHRD